MEAPFPLPLWSCSGRVRTGLAGSGDAQLPVHITGERSREQTMAATRVGIGNAATLGIAVKA